MGLQLSKRDKGALYVACVFIGIFLLVQFIIYPAMEKRGTLEQVLIRKKASEVEMITMKDKLARLSKLSGTRSGDISGRSSNFTLFSFMDRLAGEAAVKKNISYMKPSSIRGKNGAPSISLVEMKLKGVTLKELVAFVHKVEASKNQVTVQKFSLTRTGKKKALLDAVIQVETVEN